jgi:hypothetical protein
MIGTYVSAALICAASLLVGRALLLLAGRGAWTWLEPAAGFGAILAVTGLLARAPGHGTSSTLGVVLLVAAAAAVVFLLGGAGDRDEVSARRRAALRQGLPVAIAVAVVLSIPFAMTERWGLLGVGLNNDLGLHLAWAEWLRGGLGPVPDTGYPLGPHGLAVATAAFPGIGLGQAFVGEILAIGVLTGLTALGALGGLRPGRRLLAATMVAVPYLAVSYYAQGTFKETAEALFALGVAVGLHNLDVPGVSRPYRHISPGTSLRWVRVGLPWLAIAGGVFFAYSFAGLAWPVGIAVLWGLTRPAVRRTPAPRSLLRFLLRPLTLVAAALLAAVGVAVTVVGPFGFAESFNTVAAADTYGPVSPVEALGVWPTPNYRLDAPGGVQLAGLWGALGTLALLVGLYWWVRRRELAVPAGLLACALLYLAAVLTSGEYSQAKALIIGAPLAMLVAIRPLLAELGARVRSSRPPGDEKTNTVPVARLAWSALAVAFVGVAAWSSLLVLRDTPVAPAGHGGELRAFLPIVKGEPVLYAGQDRYAAYELLGADTHVPLVEFPDEAVDENPEKPFDTGDAYSPIDFDSFARGTLDAFPYVIAGRAAWNSAAPPNFKRIAETPSYLLFERTGETPEDRHVLLEGTQAGAFADCAAPEIRILLSNPGRAAVFADAVVAPKRAWRMGGPLLTGESASQRVRLPAGRWRLSLQYFAPFPLTLRAPGFSEELKPALDGQRPNTISLENDGQFWPAGTFRSPGGTVRFSVAAAEPSLLQDLSGYADKAFVGNLVAVRAEPRQTIALGEACNKWIDHYQSPAAP